MPDTNPPAPQNQFAQHPDELIKKANRNTPAVDPAAPVADATPDPVEVKALEQLKAELPDLLFGNKPVKKDEPKAPVTPAADPATPSVTPAAAAPVTPVEPPKPHKLGDPILEPAAAPAAPKAPDAPANADPAKPVDALEVARATGQAVADAINKAQAPVAPDPEPAPTADPLDRLTPEDRENYELFKVLNDSNPKYKGKHEDFLRFVNKLSSYRRRWEKENPGVSFDPADESHESFYSANQPEFADADLDKARIKLETKKQVESALKEQKEEYDRQLREVEAKAVGPQVAQQAVRVADEAINQFVSSMPDATLKEALKDPNKLREADPVAFEVINAEAALVREAVSELHNIVNRPNYFNSQNQVHMQLATYIDRQEQYIAGLPATQQVFDGKRFATREDWTKMNASQRKSHWMLTEPDIVHMLTASSAAKATQTIARERERITNMASKYGYKKDGSAAPATQAPKPPADANLAAPSKPQSPSAPAGDPTLPTNSGTKKPDAAVEKQLVNLLF